MNSRLRIVTAVLASVLAVLGMGCETVDTGDQPQDDTQAGTDDTEDAGTDDYE
jgi:hypothetical protein